VYRAVYIAVRAFGAEEPRRISVILLMYFTQAHMWQIYTVRSCYNELRVVRVARREGGGGSKLDDRVRYDLLYRNPLVPGT
jgi:hypothetical protein